MPRWCSTHSHESSDTFEQQTRQFRIAFLSQLALSAPLPAFAHPNIHTHKGNERGPRQGHGASTRGMQLAGGKLRRYNGEPRLNVADIEEE